MKPAPPEPLEPAAREAVEKRFREFQQSRAKIGINYDDVAEFALAYSAELRAELGQVEVEVQRVRDDREDVCTRLDTSAASLLQAREALKEIENRVIAALQNRQGKFLLEQLVEIKSQAETALASTSAPESSL